MDIENKNSNRLLLLEEERHKELIKAIKGLPSLLPKVDNSEIAKAIENNTKEISSFGKQLSELEVNVEAPIVNVQTNQQGVVNSIQELKDQGGRIEKLLIIQNDFLRELCTPKDFEFEFQRDRWGVMQSPIKAKSKKQTYKN